jgi:hypothetical protein
MVFVVIGAVVVKTGPGQYVILHPFMLWKKNILKQFRENFYHHQKFSSRKIISRREK